MFSDTQSNALEIWTQKQKLKEMREELRRDMILLGCKTIDIKSERPV